MKKSKLGCRLHRQQQIFRRQVHLVNRKLEKIVEHAGKEPLKQARGLLETGISVHLDQPDVVVGVKDEVEAE